MLPSGLFEDDVFDRPVDYYDIGDSTEVKTTGGSCFNRGIAAGVLDVLLEMRNKGIESRVGVVTLYKVNHIIDWNVVEDVIQKFGLYNRLKMCQHPSILGSTGPSPKGCVVQCRRVWTSGHLMRGISTSKYSS